MAIVTSQLIAAPMLQDPFVDNATDVAMSAGIITCYQDNSRTTLKNWYYQSGTAGAYTYITLPNPLTLSAAGTITDANGNDTIPFFYPYDETDNTTLQPYYITVVNSNLQAQFTRQNFPFVSTEASSTGVPTLENVIDNNVFYHNIGTLNATSVTNAILAPSQHDGFMAANYSDIRFIKNTTGATDTITFMPFGLNNDPLMNDITPEYYLNLECSGTQSGETFKVIQIPISLHIKTLEGVTATVTIQAQNVGGASNNQITLNILQFLGTGALQTSPIVPIATVMPNDTWTKYSFNFIFPSGQGVTLSNTGDDALFLQISYPLDAEFNINIAKPSIYLSPTVPTNDFQTYDQIDTVINSPRTGDVRTSINAFYPFGWVPMNDGTIGYIGSGATNRANQDTWQLFNLLWNLSVPYDSGSNFNPICQMYTSAGSATNYGMSAFDDFDSLNAIQLTSMFGRVIMGAVPISALLAYQNTAITGSNSGGKILLTITSGSNQGLYNGQPVTFTTTVSLPDSLVANAVYYVTNLTSTTFEVATTFANSIAGTVVAYGATNGSGCSVVLNTTGATLGEAQHVLSIAEMPAHAHPGSTVGGVDGAANAPAWAATLGTSTPVQAQVPSVVIASQGGGLGHNNIQSATLYNIYMKL